MLDPIVSIINIVKINGLSKPFISSLLLRYLYDFARDNEIDIWIGITENVNVSDSSI